MYKTAVKNFKNTFYPVFKSKPDFLIIGAQKAATTSLYNYLVQHPYIVKNNSWKEIRFFDLPQNFDRGFGWYLEQFPNKLHKGKRLTLDASPNYLYYPQIPKMIKKHLGDIKMIVILREPSTRAYSAWRMFHSFSNLSLKHLQKRADERSFAEAIRQELEGNTVYKPKNEPYNYVDKGKYYKQLKRYYSFFERDKILIINFEDVKKNISSVLQRICDFLEIRHFSISELKEIETLRFNVNKAREKKTEEVDMINMLKEYYQPFNENLYQLLNERYNW